MFGFESLSQVAFGAEIAAAAVTPPIGPPAFPGLEYRMLKELLHYKLLDEDE